MSYQERKNFYSICLERRRREKNGDKTTGNKKISLILIETMFIPDKENRNQHKIDGMPRN